MNTHNFIETAVVLKRLQIQYIKTWILSTYMPGEVFSLQDIYMSDENFPDLEMYEAVHQLVIEGKLFGLSPLLSWSWRHSHEDYSYTITEPTLVQ